MDNVCVVFPVLPGRTADARAFMRELDGPRMADYARSEQAIGITKELWFLASLPSGDALVGYMEAGAFGPAVAQFGASSEPFDVWFKDRMREVTGVDLGNLPADFRPPELLSRYEAAAVTR
jgi:hypothetical protein